MEKIKEEKKFKLELQYLLIKIALLIIVFIITFIFIFGFQRCNDNSMSPSFKDGDIVIYYKLANSFQINDTVIVEKDGEKQIRRVIGQEGDTIDITDEGLKINGYLQQESEIYTETLPYVKGIDFPIKVKKNEYFVLGDHRTNAKDSRLYGVVQKKEIKGSIISLIRKRGL